MNYILSTGNKREQKVKFVDITSEYERNVKMSADVARRSPLLGVPSANGTGSNGNAPGRTSATST